MIYSIDRFEGEDAVLLADNGDQKLAPRKELPRDAKETDCISLKNGTYFLEKEETAKRKKRITEFQNRLFRKKEE